MTIQESCWEVKVKGAKNTIKVCVAGDINQMTPYVLLEQEDWFENEIEFVRSYITPDMNALDIGANHGVYALNIANLLRDGHIWAFEPTQAPFRRLSQSVAINGFDHKVTLVLAGLSNHKEKAQIYTSLNSELNSLYGDKAGASESVDLTTLDDYREIIGKTTAISFVKMDAEGEELKILEGGRGFFSEQSPLVMFELKHGQDINHGLMEAFERLGYGIYRHVPGLNILVAHDKDYSESFLLNLFACKPDREQLLIQRGLLVKDPGLTHEESLTLVQTLDWKEEMPRLAYSRRFYARWLEAENTVPPEYLSALALCLKVHDESQPVSKRLALLYTAQVFTESLFSQSETPPHLSFWLLKIHIQNLLGNRLSATTLARELTQYLYRDELLDWPFLPPTTQDFTRVIADNPLNWLRAGLLELSETQSHFSSYFREKLGIEFTGLLENPNHSLLVERMGLLWLKRHHSPLELSPTHVLFNPVLTPNAQIWREIMGV